VGLDEDPREENAKEEPDDYRVDRFKTGFRLMPLRLSAYFVG
jgi:hypothetical protein